MKIKRQVNKQVLQNLLNTIKKARVSVGWTGDLAKIAYIQEYGANLKGGQPYMVDTDGYLTFLKKTSKFGRRALKAGQNSKSSNGNVKIRMKNLLPEKYNVAGLGVTKPTRIPARHLLSNTEKEYENTWKEEAKVLATKVINGEADWKSGLYTLGEAIRGDITKKIESGLQPVNTALTEMRKGFNHPLESQKNQLKREIRVIVEVSK